MTAVPSRACVRSAGWPLERVLFAMAGTAGLLGAVLAAAVSPWFLLLVAFASVNQWLYVLTGTCGASFGLDPGLRSALDPVPVYFH